LGVGHGQAFALGGNDNTPNSQGANDITVTIVSRLTGLSLF
jgi:hypothetical protein